MHSPDSCFCLSFEPKDSGRTTPTLVSASGAGGARRTAPLPGGGGGRRPHTLPNEAGDTSLLAAVGGAGGGRGGNDRPRRAGYRRLGPVGNRWLRCDALPPLSHQSAVSRCARRPQCRRPPRRHRERAGWGARTRRTSPPPCGHEVLLLPLKSKGFAQATKTLQLPWSWLGPRRQAPARHTTHLAVASGAHAGARRLWSTALGPEAKGPSRPPAP